VSRLSFTGMDATRWLELGLSFGLIGMLFVLVDRKCLSAGAMPRSDAAGCTSRRGRPRRSPGAA
jgi:hypothetical protein